MVQYAEEALSFIEGAGRSSLDDDARLAHALVRCIEVIGEAAAAVSDATREAFPTIPWRAAIGMRNRLIHSYFEVDLDRVWRTASEERGPLVQAIRESGAMEFEDPLDPPTSA